MRDNSTGQAIFIGMRVAALAGAAGLAFAAYVQTPTRTVWSGVYSAEQASRGAAAYAENCAACHGNTLAGVDVAPALTGSAFLNNWNGTSSGDLFNRIKTTMPLSAPGTLSARTVADIEAFLLQSNGFPAGSTAMPPVPALLNDTKILATKPADAPKQ